MKNSRPVRDLALCNDTPLETLVNIAALPNRSIALKLLDRGALPSEVYAVLLKREPAVRLNVAGHPDTPRAVLEQLAQDDDPLVAATARNRLTTTA